jgi:hypothetical protein
MLNGTRVFILTLDMEHSCSPTKNRKITNLEWSPIDPLVRHPVELRLMFGAGSGAKIFTRFKKNMRTGLYIL